MVQAVAFPTTKGFSISPVIKTNRITVNLHFQSLQPEHFPPFKYRIPLGNAQKKKKNTPIYYHLRNNLVHICS
jgi:hypothetical protein